LNQDTVDYIITYHLHLASVNEQTAVNFGTENSLRDFTTTNAAMKRFLEQRNRYTEDPDILKLLNNGLKRLKEQVAQNVWAENGGDTLLNLCPVCNKIARTPKAKQCRYCKHDWHQQIAGSFKINSAIRIKKRHLFVVGQLVSGTVKKGNFLELNFPFSGYKPQILAVEYALIRKNGIAHEDLGLAIEGLSPTQEKALLEKGNKLGCINILNAL